MSEGFTDSFEHLRAELHRITRLLHRAVLIASARPRGDVPDSLAGQVIYDGEVEALFAHQDLLEARWAPASFPEAVATRIEALDLEIEQSRARIDDAARTAIGGGVRLPLARLAEEFQFTNVEQEILLLALAPELEPSFERIFAFLHDDVTRTRPTVDLVLNVICRDAREKLRSRSLLAPGGRLRHFGFVEVVGNSSSTLLASELRVDETVVRFLLDHDGPAVTVGVLESVPAADTAAKLPRKTRAELPRLLDALTRHDTSHFTLLLTGSDPVLLDSAACSVAHALRRRTLGVRLDLGSGKLLGKLHLALRDAALWDALLVLDLTAPEAADRESPLPALLREVEELVALQAQPLILLCAPGVTPHLPTAGALWSLTIDPPDYDDRMETWRAVAGEVTDANLPLLSDSFRFTEEQAAAVYRLAYGAAALRDPGDPRVNGNDLLLSARVTAAPRLKRFAIPIEPRFVWNDIVLPEPKLAQLRAIVARVRHRHTVQRDWGFGKKHSRGLGQNILFTGASGTGKTMAAEVLANELSLHLFQIDLSAVVSKFVGETEKNLAAVFDEAELGNCLLFFDEGDAIFGKRTELKDAHDRYSNIEVSYLLQRIERFQGVVILASNLQKNIDDAFLRRLHEVVDFPFPDEGARERIWTRHVPAEVPIDPDVDFRFLAQRFKLSGGNVSNAVRNAAYAAAAEDSRLSMRHIVRAVRDEYTKLGRLTLHTEFEPYFHFLGAAG
ncbi:MAG TPA: ATP-binding protein [Polyangiaceae bacterium]|nr:ATP-binding protein [Polyangiaceae bacterium]